MEIPFAYFLALLPSFVSAPSGPWQLSQRHPQTGQQQLPEKRGFSARSTSLSGSGVSCPCAADP